MALVDRDGRDPDEMDIEPEPEPEPEYVAVIYLLNRGTWPIVKEDGSVSMGGAFGQGHAAILLVRDDGSGYFFSYAGEFGDIILDGTEGWLSTHVDENGNIESIDVEEFLASGKVDSDRVDSKNKNKKEAPDEYSHGIYIPITDEEGIAMYNEAMEIRENPGKYKLFSHNCNQMAQQILAAGDKSFASMDFDWFDTRPNAVYDNATEEILQDKPEGWNYGTLENILKGVIYNRYKEIPQYDDRLNLSIEWYGDIIYKC